MAGGIGSSALLGWYQSFFGGRGTGTSASLVTGASGGGLSSSISTPAVLYAPTPPWQQNLPSQKALVQRALGGAQLFNPSSVKLDMPNASANYKSLFSLYTGLNSLFAVANAASATGVSTGQVSALNNAFSSGMQQLSTFLSQTAFAGIKLTPGTAVGSETTTVSTPAQATTYTTPPLNTTGDSNAVVPAFEGDVSFNITAQLGKTTTQVPINLDDMDPTTPRTMGNVVNFLNAQLKQAGVFATFSSLNIPATPDTITTTGGKSVTVSAGKASWALQLHTSAAETISFSADSTGPAVYVGQTVGNTTSTKGTNGATVAADAQSQLLKFNASGDGTVGPTTPAHAAATQISTTQLGASATSINATATAPDGSVYVLANVTAASSGTAAVGGQDVALQKYDSAGHLLFSTDLGSDASASGLSLAVSADGSQVAITGKVTGSLDSAQSVLDPTGANGFVAVYDDQGNQVWQTQTDGLNPNQASAVAFGADGSVYVTGQSQTSTAVQAATGPANSYLQVYSPVGKSEARVQIASGGSNTSNGIAVDGNNVYVAGVQNGDAVVSEYDVTNPKAPTLVTSRDLGALGGGNVVGVQVQNGKVYVAGTSGSGTLNAGTVTSPPAGSGFNAFAATLSTGLAPSSSDSIAYYGGTGSTLATGMTVSGGDVYLTGSTTGDLPGEPAIGTRDGFVAGINVATGSVDYAQRFTGLDGKVAPTSIAVASSGESVLDQLGLPQGAVDGPVSDLITSTTSVNAGDSFSISVSGGSPVKITIKATDTMASLASEIAQKTGNQVTASTALGAHGATSLTIKPAYPGVTVSLVDGPSGHDALSGLGLKPGYLVNTTLKNGVKVMSGASATPVFGLGLPASLDLSSGADIKTAQVQIAGALSVVEQAYQTLKTAATPASVLAAKKAQGAAVPTAIANQIANYQAALQRLTAGQSSSGTGGASLL